MSKPHTGNPATSDRLRKVLEYFRARGISGATTLEAQRDLFVCGITTTISDLRRTGHMFERVFETSATGKRMTRYIYRGYSATAARDMRAA